MSEVVKLDPPKIFSYSKTITKIVDGEAVEFVDIDELPASERFRYFHLAERQRASDSELPDAVVLPLTPGRPR